MVVYHATKPIKLELLLLKTIFFIAYIAIHYAECKIQFIPY